MRIGLTIGAVAVTALALTACQSKQTGAPLPAPIGEQQPGTFSAVPPPATNAEKSQGGLDKVSEASLKAGTAKVKGTLVADMAGQQMELSTSEGEIDFTNKKSKTTLTMKTPGSPDAGSKTTSIFVDNKGYLQYVLNGKPGPWMTFDMTAMLGKQGAADMGTYISFMAGITDSTQVGTEAIGAVATTHYKVTVDPVKAMEKYPEAKEFIKSMLAAGEKLVPGSSAGIEADANKPQQMDLWIDKDGKIYRLLQENKVKGDDGQEITAKTTTEFYDYGGPVDIKAPI